MFCSRMSLWKSALKSPFGRMKTPGPNPAALAALERHIAGARPGLWIERMDAAGQAVAEPAPATSLYHLTAALTDAAVLEPRL